MRARIKSRKISIVAEATDMQRNADYRKSVFNEVVLPRVKYYMDLGKEYATAKKFAMAEIKMGLI